MSKLKPIEPCNPPDTKYIGIPTKIGNHDIVARYRYSCDQLQTFADTPVPRWFTYSSETRDWSLYKVVEGNYTELAAATLCTTVLGENGTLARWVNLML